MSYSERVGLIQNKCTNKHGAFNGERFVRYFLNNEKDLNEIPFRYYWHVIILNCILEEQLMKKIGVTHKTILNSWCHMDIPLPMKKRVLKVCLHYLSQ